MGLKSVHFSVFKMGVDSQSMTPLTEEEGKCSPQLACGAARWAGSQLCPRGQVSPPSAPSCLRSSARAAPEHAGTVAPDSCTPPLKNQRNKHFWSISRILGFQRHFAFVLKVLESAPDDFLFVCLKGI